ncbi:hypothetical protein [Microbulbifer sediminum]|uniref:hypothetical protein n=1 Tax=Microbulbifer sediminum TaxID=2904250 RepID=UPI001F3BB993|nr:hypothetical protein [Microbulbifer sediminum]
MKSELVQWWGGVPAPEKRALITLGVIAAGILVFCLGLQAGKALAVATSLF